MVLASRIRRTAAVRSAAERRGTTPVLVTDAALDQMAVVRDKQHPRPNQSLGLISEPGGRIGLVLDVPDQGDRVLVRHGVPVLFIAAAVERSLHDRLIDFEGVSGNGQFTIKRLSTEVDG